VLQEVNRWKLSIIEEHQLKFIEDPFVFRILVQIYSLTLIFSQSPENKSTSPESKSTSPESKSTSPESKSTSWQPEA